jgi:hypothetical protein
MALSPDFLRHKVIQNRPTLLRSESQRPYDAVKQKVRDLTMLSNNQCTLVNLHCISTLACYFAILVKRDKCS